MPNHSPYIDEYTGICTFLCLKWHMLTPGSTGLTSVCTPSLENLCTYYPLPYQPQTPPPPLNTTLMKPCPAPEGVSHHLPALHNISINLCHGHYCGILGGSVFSNYTLRLVVGIEVIHFKFPSKINCIVTHKQLEHRLTFEKPQT